MTLSAQAVEHFTIDHTTDPAYLPYSLQEVSIGIYQHYREEPPIAVRVYEVKHGDSGRALFAAGYPESPQQDAPSTVGRFDALAGTVIDEDPFWAGLRNLDFYRDPATGDVAMLCLYVWSDSAFILRRFLGGESTDTLFLSTGVDHTGDSLWYGGGEIRGLTDLNVDGSPEFYLHMTPGRDLEPRVFFSIDLTTFSVNWQLPMASLGSNVQARADSAEPFLLLTTYGPANGTSDSIFTDQLGYVTCVAFDGTIRWNRIAGINYTKPLVLLLPDQPDLAVLYHTVPIDMTENDALAVETIQPTLSLIRIADGTIVKTVASEVEVGSLWLARLDRDRPPAVLTLSPDGVLSVYDQELQLQRQSGPSDLQAFTDTLAIGGQTVPAMLFTRTGGVSLYSADFRQLATLDAEPSTILEPLAFDAGGHLTHFVLEKGLVAGIAKRRFVDILTIWFWRSRIYVMSILSALVVGLIVTNYFRHRARSSMLLIARQKRELEETHAQLKAAQAQIVAQEKFRQAKDILGGYAHEIRNALFPATAELHRRRRGLERAPDIELLADSDRRIERAVGRALDVTDACGEYTRLETDYDPAPVALHGAVTSALDSLKSALSPTGIEVVIQGDPGAKVIAGRSHLEAVFAHLLQNSIDALANTPSPRIDIHWAAETDRVRVTVRDNGEGIAAELHDRVFEPFFSTRPQTGLGLGLAVVKKIVAMYDGAIIIESTPGEGTSVQVRLPGA